MPLPPEIAADIEAILAEFGEPITWNNQTLTALVSEAPVGETPGLGGWVEQGDLTVKLLRSQIQGDLPVVGQTLRFGSEQYRIARVSNRSGRPLLILFCVAKDE